MMASVYKLMNDKLMIHSNQRRFCVLQTLAGRVETPIYRLQTFCERFKTRIGVLKRYARVSKRYARVSKRYARVSKRYTRVSKRHGRVSRRNVCVLNAIKRLKAHYRRFNCVKFASSERFRSHAADIDQSADRTRKF
jgi:hypothetical protein